MLLHAVGPQPRALHTERLPLRRTGRATSQAKLPLRVSVVERASPPSRGEAKLTHPPLRAHQNTTTIHCLASWLRLGGDQPDRMAMRQRSCKNCSKECLLPRDQVDTQRCRKSLRKSLCKTSPECLEPRGRREVLEQNQVRVLFRALLDDGAAWAAALLVLQVCCGERVGAISRAKFGWLKNLGPSCRSTPSI